MKVNDLNQAHQVLATKQIRIATEQAKVDAKIKEPYKGVLIDVEV